MNNSKESFTQFEKREYHQFEIEGVDGEFRCRSFMELERDEIRERLNKEKNSRIDAEAAHVVQLSLCNDEGDLIFAEGDVPTIRKWRSHVLRGIYLEIDRVFGIAAIKEPERVEEAAKNSNGTPILNSA